MSLNIQLFPLSAIPTLCPPSPPPFDEFVPPPEYEAEQKHQDEKKNEVEELRAKLLAFELAEKKKQDQDRQRQQIRIHNAQIIPVLMEKLQDDIISFMRDWNKSELNTDKFVSTQLMPLMETTEDRLLMIYNIIHQDCSGVNQRNSFTFSSYMIGEKAVYAMSGVPYIGSISASVGLFHTFSSPVSIEMKKVLEIMTRHPDHTIQTYSGYQTYGEYTKTFHRKFKDIISIL